jgi:hypothetical protein
MPPSLANTWKVTVAQVIGTVHFENVVHVTAPGASDPEDVATDVGHAWTHADSFYDIQSGDCAYDSLSVQLYDGVSAPILFDNTHFSHTQGHEGSGASSIQVSGVVTLRSVFAGRSARGRLYIGGIASSKLGSPPTRWNPSNAAELQLAGDTFLAQIAAGSVTTDLNVYSALNNTKVAVATTKFRDNYLGTQRRRSEQME